MGNLSISTRMNEIRNSPSPLQPTGNVLPEYWQVYHPSTPLVPVLVTVHLHGCQHVFLSSSPLRCTSCFVFKNFFFPVSIYLAIYDGNGFMSDFNDLAKSLTRFGMVLTGSGCSKFFSFWGLSLHQAAEFEDNRQVRGWVIDDWRNEFVTFKAVSNTEVSQPSSGVDRTSSHLAWT